jgi:signal transduction histidine kinase
MVRKNCVVWEKTMNRSARISRVVLLLATILLAIILPVFSLRTSRALAEMQQIYLRDRASRIADRLERLSPDHLTNPLMLDRMRHQEPGLIGLRSFRENEQDGSAAIEAMWSGRELYRTEITVIGGRRIFRAWMPFESAQGFRIARIDLDFTGADFLMTHARRNILVASFSGATLMMLGLWAVWSARRAALLEKRQLQLEHLAHLGHMSAILAHEIRNPLGTIKGFAQLACEKADQRVLALLAPVLNEIGRLEKLVKDLLLYGKPCQPEWHWIEWGSIGRDLQPFVANAIGARPFRYQCVAEDFEFETDPDLLKEALLNLLRNSVEALGQSEKGEVRLRVVPGPPLIIAVEDDGPGMTEAMNGHLFEPYYTTKASGTGLGLSVARKLVESLRGELRFVPVEPHGTRAELRFPQAQVRHGTYSDH